MNKTRKSGHISPKLFSIAFAILWVGCTTYLERSAPPVASYPEPTPPPQIYTPPPAPAYVPPPVVYETQPPPPSGLIEVRTEMDFDEPLRPYGRWEFIEPYGRCWIPIRVDPDWRPYSNGSWRRTPDGWYWQSNEPWGWATYHYGRWDFNPQVGWYWVPRTQWAPAWVEWRQGAGYVGWAPLHPSAWVTSNGVVEESERPLPPRHYVFVEERKFLAPVRPATTVVNNTTIINNTVNISNIKVVNNTVINEGPRTTVIEQASGQRVQTVPVHELRRAQEAPVVATQRVPRASDNTVRNPAPREIPSRENNARLEAERRANEAKVQARPDSQNPAKEIDPRAAQIEAERIANEAKSKAQQEAQRRALEERQANLAKFQAQQAAQRIAQERERAAQIEAERRTNQAKIQAQQELRIAQERDRTNRIEVERRASEARAKTNQEPQKLPIGPTPDAAMVARVQKALSLNPRYKQVRVAVSKGVLELSGFAATEEVKKQAAEFVKGMAGVKTVQNNISTKP